MSCKSGANALFQPLRGAALRLARVEPQQQHGGEEKDFRLSEVIGRLDEVAAAAAVARADPFERQIERRLRALAVDNDSDNDSDGDDGDNNNSSGKSESIDQDDMAKKREAAADLLRRTAYRGKRLSEALGGDVEEELALVREAKAARQAMVLRWDDENDENDGPLQQKGEALLSACCGLCIASLDWAACGFGAVSVSALASALAGELGVVPSEDPVQLEPVAVGLLDLRHLPVGHRKLRLREGLVGALAYPGSPVNHDAAASSRPATVLFRFEGEEVIPGDVQGAAVVAVFSRKAVFDSFGELPLALQDKVIGMLSPAEHRRAACVCRSFRDMVAQAKSKAQLSRKHMRAVPDGAAILKCWRTCVLVARELAETELQYVENIDRLEQVAAAGLAAAAEAEHAGTARPKPNRGQKLLDRVKGKKPGERQAGLTRAADAWRLVLRYAPFLVDRHARGLAELQGALEGAPDEVVPDLLLHATDDTDGAETASDQLCPVHVWKERCAVDFERICHSQAHTCLDALVHASYIAMRQEDGAGGETLAGSMNKNGALLLLQEPTKGAGPESSLWTSAVGKTGLQLPLGLDRAEALAIMPMCRLPRYVLLMGEFSKCFQQCSCESAQDRELMMAVTQRIRDILDEGNQFFQAFTAEQKEKDEVCRRG